MVTTGASESEGELNSSRGPGGFLRAAPILHRFHDHFKLVSKMGNVRTRMPVAAKIALHSAGAAAGSPGSPSPVGGADDLTNSTSTTGGA